MVEAVVAIAVIGIGVASTVGVVTKMNQFASQSRNSTGANAIVMNQVDLFQSAAPFIPQKSQIPQFTEPSNNPSSLPSYDMTVGSHTIGYKNPATGVVSNQWPVYQYEDASGVTIVVTGTLTVQVTDISPSSTVMMYQGVITLNYSYLNRAYSVSMTAIRASDT